MSDPVSAGMQIAASIVGGIQQHGSLRRAANVDLENARLSTLQGELDAQQTRRDELLAVGAGLAASASDGVALGTGSMADLVEQSALEREREILELRIQAEGQAKNLRQSASDKKRQATFALINGFLGAGAAGAGAVSDSRNNARVTVARQANRDSQMGNQMGIGPRRRFGGLPGY